jgi:hypothetical protein
MTPGDRSRRTPGDRVSIARVRPAGDAEWDAAWLGCDHATYFHSRAWAEIWAAYRPRELRPAPRAVEFSDGRSALLPLSAERPRGRGPWGHRSSPAGCYGGWISAQPLGKAHAELLCAYLLEQVAGLTWRVSPWDPFALAVTAGLGDVDHTRSVRLEGGFEALERRFASGARSAAQRAVQEGLEVGIATATDEWRAYDRACRDSLSGADEQTTPRHVWDLFERIRARDARDARLWVVRLRGEVVAGALVLYAPRHAAWWHGAAVGDCFRNEPMHLLLHAMIRDACEQDLAVFDLGPSHGHGGVEELKSAYATETLPCPMLRCEPAAWGTRLRRILERPRRRGFTRAGRALARVVR